MKILIINGPNLNLLGLREPQIYGAQSFDAYVKELKHKFANAEIIYCQTNSEGAIIDELQKAVSGFDGIVLNAGAYSHTSIAIGDSVKCCTIPIIEVHISNIYSREDYRHKSYISAYCKGVIVGFGLYGYSLAISSLIHFHN